MGLTGNPRSLNAQHLPQTSMSLLRTYDCYRADRGKFDHTHDIGTSPGNIAEEVGKNFAKVHASDPSEYRTAVAGHRLRASDLNKYTTQHSRREAVSGGGNGHEAGSADLVTVAQYVPLMDLGKAIYGFATLLKPNNTLAV